MKIELVGMKDAEAQLRRIERGLKALAKAKAYVGSRAPYGHGIERGHHRVSGKLARRAGGARYLQGAVDTVMSNADADLTEGMRRVTAPGPWVLLRLARWARRLARQDVPRETGRLRRTIIAGKE